MTAAGAPVEGTNAGWPTAPEPRRQPDRALGVGGYLVAGALAVVLFAALSVANLVITGGSYPAVGVTSDDVQVTLLITLTFGGGAALFPGVPLAVGAHYWVRRNPSEIVHVAAFAAVGGLTALIVLAVLGLAESGQVWVLILETAAATAVSRFAVGRVHLTRQPERG